MRIFLIILLILLGFSGHAAAVSLQDNEDVGQRLLDQLSLEEVNQFIRKLNGDLDENMPLLDSATIRNITSKGLNLNWDDIGKIVMSKIGNELATNINLMGKLILLALLCALLQNLQNSFEKSGISLLAYGICYVFMMIIILKAVYNTIHLAQQTVSYMVGFMEALLPVMISLMAGVGAITSAALLTPFMLFIVNSVSVIIKDIVLPLLFLTCLLECVNYLSDKYRLTHLTSLFKQSGMVVLSFTLVLFIGVITIQGIAGSVTDGLALRTAKFATSTFVPVVGGVFADAVSTVMGATLLLRNAIGIFGVIVVMTICVLPAIKILAMILTIKIAGAVIQPVGNEKMAQCLTGIGNNLLLLFGAVATVALMFFLSLTMIIGVGSMAMILGR